MHHHDDVVPPAVTPFEQQALAFGADTQVELQRAEAELTHAWGDLERELLRIRDLLSGADKAA